MRDTTPRIWSRTIPFFVVLAIASTAYAKGSFQAEGIISGFQRRGDEVTFRFTGRISSTYATAPASDSRREWKDLVVIAAGITLKIGDWTRRNKPDETADPAEVGREVDRISADLSDLAEPVELFGSRSTIRADFLYQRRARASIRDMSCALRH